jgi:hypothetical protein
MTDVSPQLLDPFATLWFVIARVTPAFIAQTEPLRSPEMFKPQSTPAHPIFDLSILVLKVTDIIFVFGSNQIELAGTVLPILGGD